MCARQMIQNQQLEFYPGHRSQVHKLMEKGAPTTSRKCYQMWPTVNGNETKHERS